MWPPIGKQYAECIGIRMAPFLAETMARHTTNKSPCRAITESPMATGSASTAKSDGMPRPASGSLKSAAFCSCKHMAAIAATSVAHLRLPSCKPKRVPIRRSRATSRSTACQLRPSAAAAMAMRTNLDTSSSAGG